MRRDHGPWCNDRRDGSALTALDAEVAKLQAAGRVHVRVVSKREVFGSVYADDGSHHVSYVFPRFPAHVLTPWNCSCGSERLCVGVHALVRLTTMPLTVFGVAA